MEAAHHAAENIAHLNVMHRNDNATRHVLFGAENEADFVDELHHAVRESPASQQIGPFTEAATIKAKLYRIGGRDESAHAQLMDAAGKIWNGVLTQEQAANMAATGGRGLYKWFLVHGSAKWIRTADSRWKLQEFRITDFSLLPATSLTEEIARLQSIEGSQWGDLNDPTAFIQTLRNGNDRTH